MTILFVIRHPGALEWAQRQGIACDTHIEHLDPAQVGPGDTVVGILPMHLAAAVCARGARYLNLTLDLPAELRGPELDVATLEACGARIEEYRVEKIR